MEPSQLAVFPPLTGKLCFRLSKSLFFGGWDHTQLDERIYVTSVALIFLLPTRCNRPQPGAPNETGGCPFREWAAVQVE